jgi:hypothetical protein
MEQLVDVSIVPNENKPLRCFLFDDPMFSRIERQKPTKVSDKLTQSSFSRDDFSDAPSDEAHYDKDELTNTQKERPSDLVKKEAPVQQVVEPALRNNNDISSNAFASGSNANGPNVITGRPSSRVLAPPGGHCSIRLY